MHINSLTSRTIIPNHIRCHRHSRCLSPCQSRTQIFFIFFFFHAKKHFFLYHIHHRNPSRYAVALAHKLSHSLSWNFILFRMCLSSSLARSSPDRYIMTGIHRNFWNSHLREFRYFQSHLPSPLSCFNKQFLILAPLWVARYLPSMIILTLLLDHLKCCLISAWRSLDNAFTFFVFKLILVRQTEIKTLPSWILKVPFQSS